MAEYDIQINRFNQVNVEYDQLYPQAMKHGATHLPNGDDPIGLTYSDVDAAPAGYGLGEVAKEVNNIDNLRVTGFYKFYNRGIALISGVLDTYYSNVEVITSGLGTAQRITSAHEGYQAVRRFVNNAWTEWEWVNPPMTLGVEYRTTERYLGRPVYVKTFNAGALPNNSYKVVFTTGGESMSPAIAIISVTGSVVTSSSEQLVIPGYLTALYGGITPVSTENKVEFGCGGGDSIILKTNYDATNVTATRLTVKYFYT